MDNRETLAGSKNSQDRVRGVRHRRAVLSWRRLVRNPANRGQELVEFAVVAILFFLFLFGVVDMARLFQALVGITNAARVGARYGTAYGDDLPGNSQVDMNAEKIKTAACQETANYNLNSALTSVQVCCPGVGNVISCAAARCIDTISPLSYPVCKSRVVPLQVQVQYQFQLIMTGIIPGTSLPLTYRTEMLLP